MHEQEHEVTNGVEPARTARYELSVDIAASVDEVWSSLVGETHAWWPKDFRALGDDSVVMLDARAGGHLLETRENGDGLLWYTVQMCGPGPSLHLVGAIAPEWGGPSVTMLHVRLQPHGDGTRVLVTDALVGHLTDAKVAELKQGWTSVFESLRRHLED